MIFRRSVVLESYGLIAYILHMHAREYVHTVRTFATYYISTGALSQSVRYASLT